MAENKVHLKLKYNIQAKLSDLHGFVKTCCAHTRQGSDVLLDSYTVQLLLSTVETGASLA